MFFLINYKKFRKIWNSRLPIQINCETAPSLLMLLSICTRMQRRSELTDDNRSYSGSFLAIFPPKKKKMWLRGNLLSLHSLIIIIIYIYIYIRICTWKSKVILSLSMKNMTFFRNHWRERMMKILTDVRGYLRRHVDKIQ